MEDLTETEATIAIELAKGAPVAKVAKKLKRSPKTIETHKSRIYKKLNVNHRIGLARAVIKAGLLESEKWLRSKG